MNTAPVNGQDVVCFVVIEISFNISFFRGKVNNNAARTLEQAHIVIQLCAHVSIQLINRFAFNNNVSLAQKINSIYCFHFLAMVGEMNSQFLLKWDSLFLEL